MSEYTDLQKPAHEWLKHQNILFYHIEKGRSLNKTHRGGYPDLWLMPGLGRIYFIEFKLGNGKLKDSQVQKFAELEGFGYPIKIIRSMDDFKNYVSSIMSDRSFNIRQAENNHNDD